MLSTLESIGQTSEAAFLSDTPNVVLAKFQALFHGPTHFTAKDFFISIFGMSPNMSSRWNPFYRSFGLWLRNAIVQRAAGFRRAVFDMHGALPSPNYFLIRQDLVSLTDHPYLISSSPSLSIINGRQPVVDRGRLVQLSRTSALHNYLLFVASTFGNSYYLAGLDRHLGRVSMYQPERDYFYRGGVMASLGRVSLFRVLAPASRLRLSLEFTASLNADRDNRIPPASVVGETRLMLPVEGRGSARLFSAPFALQVIEGGQYVALDMGTWGRSFPTHRSAIMSLYGRDIPMDPRRVVGFARDISLISEEEYASLAPPECLNRFPGDLSNRALEYSGIYEDGWLSESSYVVLRQSEPDADLLVSIGAPRLRGQLAAPSLRVLLDGRDMGRLGLRPGEASIRVRSHGGGRHRVGLQFDGVANLPDPDNRPVSAQLRQIGFVRAAPTALDLKEAAAPQ